MTYGLTSEGFSIPTVDDLLSAMTMEQRTAIASDLDDGAEALLGQLNGITALKLREVWEAALAVYESLDPRVASGAALRARCALVGVEPRAATQGTVTLTLTIAAHRTVPVGSQVSAPGRPEVLWTTTADAANNTGGSASVTVEAQCETAGRLVAPSGTLTVIATPVSGWSAVTNAADAIPGRDADSDTVLRARRDAELQANGLTTDGSIRAAVGAVEGVRRVLVVTNNGDSYSGLQPPHSVECVVQGGADADVASAIFGTVARGVATYGGTSTSVLDAAGVAQQVFYTRPSERNVYVSVLVARTNLYAGDAAVKAAILAVGDALLMGSTVQIADLIVAVMGVAGVRNARVTVSWLSSGAGTSDLIPGVREIPTLDTSRVSVGYL